MGQATLGRFDTDALYTAMDRQREALGLSWNGVAREIWALSSELHQHRPDDHPFSPSTIASMKRRGATSCQHAMFMLRWLDRSPEHFVRGGPPLEAPPLPVVGSDRTIRLSLELLYASMDEKRRAEGLTWKELADVFGCQPGQLSRMPRARYAVGMDIAMKIVQWVGRPSVDFMYAGRW